MNARRTAIIAVMAVIIALAVPCTLSSDSNAVGSGDVIINVDGGGSSVSMDVDSGGSASALIYVTNTSDSYLSLDVYFQKHGDLSFSSSVTVNGTSSQILYPAGDSNGRHIALVTVTVASDVLADTGTVDSSVTLRFTDLGVSPGSGGNAFDMSVPMNVDIHSVYTSEGSFNQFFGLFPNTLPAPFDQPWFTALATLVLWILFSIIACEIIIPMLARLAGSRKTPEEKKMLTKTLTTTISVLMFVVAMNECLNIVGANAEIMSAVSTLSLVLYVVFGAILAWQIYKFVITAIINGLDEAVDVDGIDASLIPLFKMIGKLVITVMAATVILAAFGVDLAGIMVSAGVITLGITFGAQEIISQFFSGIVLLATRPFKKGDFISINGTTYVVRKVRLMYTEFDNWDKDQVVTIPNNTVRSATMVNFTKGNANTRIYIYVTLAFDADLTKAKELMIQAANMHPHVVKDGTVSRPGTRLTNFREYGIEYRLACYVDDYDNNSHYAGQIREIMYKLFKDNGIRIPYARMEIELDSPCDGRKRADDTSDD